MSWLLGAGMGFLRGGPLGAIVGGTIQHFFSKKVIKKNKPRFSGGRRSERFCDLPGGGFD